MSRKNKFNKLSELSQTGTRFLSRVNIVQFYPESEILGDKGIRIDESNKNLSFKNFIKNGDFIKNPNILEEQIYSNIKNDKMSTEKNFDDENDPFYDIDEDSSIKKLSDNDEKSQIINLKLKTKKIKNTQRGYANAN